MKNVSSQRLAFLFLLLTFIAFQSAAQDLDTARISGRVLDQNGAVVPGATIKATLIKTGAARVVSSDSEGRYHLIQMEPGTFVINASSNGFAPREIRDLTILSGQSVQLDIALSLSTLNIDPVVINATSTSVIDTKRTTVGGALNTREIETLPIVTRSILDLVFTLPGVTEEPLSTRDLAEDRDTSVANTPEEAGNFSLAGSPAYSNNLTIDGLDNNDDRAARERFQPPIDAVDEVQVITNQFSAEYGRASGGRINLRTRSGSQQFKGRAFYFFRDEALNSNTFRNNSMGVPRLPLQDHIGGFTISGPVRMLPLKPNVATVFLIAYEHEKVLDSALIDTLVPLKQNPLFPLPPPTTLVGKRLEQTDEPALAADVARFISSISTPLTNTSLTGRVDHQFSQMHNLSAVYQLGRSMNLRQFGGGNRLTDALQGRLRDSDAISLSDNYVLSAQLVNQTRFQYSRLAPAFEAQGGRKPVVLITLNDPLVAEDPERRSGTLVAGSSTSGGTDRREVRLQVQEVLSLIRENHSFKFGADIHYVRSTFLDLSDLTGTFSFASAGDFLASIPSRYRQNFQSDSTQQNTYAGFFIQDEWQMLPQLLVSYGLRYERETILDDRNNFGPRFSLAYSPLKSGKLVMRVGSGMFFNRALLRTIDDFTLGRQQLFFDTNLLREPSTGKLMTPTQRRSFIASNLRFPETLTPESTLVTQFGLLNTTFSRRLDPSLRIPESYQLNAGIEHDLGRGYGLEANVTFTRGSHLWREFNANAPALPPGYRSLSEFLASRDFANFASPATRTRPIYNAANAGEIVRFVYANPNQTNANLVSRVVEFGIPVSVISLNSPTSSTAIQAALAAVNNLRPDPTQAEVEQLISAGNSFYRGVTLELRKRFDMSENGPSFSFRAGYTMSRLIDDGIVNTSDALVAGDFRAERARSLLDRKHRFVFSGTFNLPNYLGGLQLSPIWRVASGSPFNISIGGADRNLDDVGNDRPNFAGDKRLLRWRAPGKGIDPSVAALFSLPLIGQSGNLPRNAGIGPAQFLFDLNATREFRLSERVRLRPVVEFDNVLNKTVFSFGSEFINFNALSPSASEEQRQVFLNSFLRPTRTMRPRQIRLGLRIDF